MTGLACDTSVLVSALVAWHPEHAASRSALLESQPAVPAHVLVETYSVLTRLPAPHRIAAADAARVLAGLALRTLSLPASKHRGLISRLADERIAGGAVYDAVVASTAAHHGLRLLTRDRRARATYDALGVSYTLL